MSIKSIEILHMAGVKALLVVRISKPNRPPNPTVCAGVRGRWCVLNSVGQLNARLALESGGASDSVMVHLLNVSEGVGGGGVAEVWRAGRADKMNSSIKSRP